MSLWVISYVSTAAAGSPEKLVMGDTFPVWMSGHACPWQLAKPTSRVRAITRLNIKLLMSTINYYLFQERVYFLVAF